MTYPVKGSYTVNKNNHQFTISDIAVLAPTPSPSPNTYIAYNVTEKGEVHRVTRLIADNIHVWNVLRTQGAGSDNWGLSALSCEEIKRGLITHPYAKSSYYARVASDILIKAAPPPVPIVDPNKELIEEVKALETEKASLTAKINELKNEFTELRAKKNQQNADITKLTGELGKLTLDLQRALQ